MQVKPENRQEKWLLQRIEFSRNPVNHLVVPGLLLAAIIFGLSAIRDLANDELRILPILMSGFFFWQAWSLALMLRERRTVHDLLDRLTKPESEES